MRIRGRIGAIALALALGSTSCPGVPAAAAAPAPAGSDSADAWLPPAAEDLEREEALAEPPREGAGAAAVLVRADNAGRGAVAPRRIAAEVERRGGRGTVSVAALEVDGAWRPTVALRAGGIGLAGGRLVLRDAPPSFAQRLRLARSAARVPQARAAAAALEAPLAATAPALEGAGLALGAGGASGWCLAGRRAADRATVAAGGASFPLPGGRASVAGALGAGERAGAASIRLRRGRSAGSLEALAAREGVAWLAAAESYARPLEVSGRWRAAASGPRAVAAELAAAVRGRAGSARVTWRSWTSTARTDNGAVELDLATDALGSGCPARARLSGRPSGPAGPGSRAATLDATVARSGGRSLAALASWRRGTGGRQEGRTLGGRLTLEAARGGRLEIQAVATRAAAGSTTAAERLHASGALTLEERAGSGFTLTSRGTVPRGPVTAGFVIDREERADGARSLAATVWLRWNIHTPSGGGRAAADPLPPR